MRVCLYWCEILVVWHSINKLNAIRMSEKDEKVIDTNKISG